MVGISVKHIDTGCVGNAEEVLAERISEIAGSLENCGDIKVLYANSVERDPRSSSIQAVVAFYDYNEVGELDFSGFMPETPPVVDGEEVKPVILDASLDPEEDDDDASA